MRKKLLCILSMMILILSIAGVNMNGVSSVGSPTIAVDPDTIINSTLTVGASFNVSIYTNYTGTDVWAYEFTLSYNPDVLHGGIPYTDTWSGDGTKTEWNTTYPPHHDSQKVYVNSSLKTPRMQGSDTWAGNGIETVYVTSESPVVPGSEFVYVNNTLQQRGVDYTIDYDTGTITFTSPPADGAPIRATYTHGHYEIHYPSGTITFNSNSVPGAGSTISALYTYKVYDIEYTFDQVIGWYATIKFANPPGVNDDIDVEYLYGGVYNGDLISFDDPYFGGFNAGFHNVTEGTLSLTTANLLPLPFATTSGPGTLANVTFQVVGYGSSNITLGPETKLKAYASVIIDGGANPDQLEHGYFRNMITGDVNADKIVDIFDILKVKYHWYPGPPVGAGGYNRDVDINDDKSIDIFDILLVKANWGNTAP